MKYTDIEFKELSRYIQLYDFSDELKNKTVLITGSKGLVGTGLVKWILFQNETRGTNTKILASTRNPEDIPEFINAEDNITYCKYGKELELGCRIDYIIHAASPTGNKYHMAHPVETFRTNVDSMERMIEIARKNSSSTLLYLSSEEVYGLPSDNSPALKETMVGTIDSLNLRNCYPLAKKACEFLCYAAASEYEIEAKIIRPTVIHGLFQRYEEPRVVNELLRCILENKDFMMKSDGLTKKCLMYSLDAISAIFVVLLRGKSGEAYNASNPDTFLTVRDLADYLFKTFNPQIKTIFSKEQCKKTDGFLPHRTLIQDCSKLMELGWKPESGIEKIYQVDIQRFRTI